MTAVTLRFGDTTARADLDDSATAADLLTRLPLTLPFNDFHDQEKLATLPAPLSLEGAPRGSGADAGDIGYYAPAQALVLYHGRVGRFLGIVPIGRYDADAIPAVRALPDGSDITLQQA